MTTRSWPLLLLAIIGASTIIAGLGAVDWAAWTCFLPQGEEGKSLAPGIGACYEFWINRYQTLITGVFAGAAAVSAFSAVRYSQKQAAAAVDQVVEARIQTSEALKQGAISAYEFYAGRITKFILIEKAKDAIARRCNEFLPAIIYNATDEDIENLIQFINAEIKIVVTAMEEMFWENSDKGIVFLAHARGLVWDAQSMRELRKIEKDEMYFKGFFESLKAHYKAIARGEFDDLGLRAEIEICRREMQKLLLRLNN